MRNVRLCYHSVQAHTCGVDLCHMLGPQLRQGCRTWLWIGACVIGRRQHKREPQQSRRPYQGHSNLQTNRVALQTAARGNRPKTSTAAAECWQSSRLHLPHPHRPVTPLLGLRLSPASSRVFSLKRARHAHRWTPWRRRATRGRPATGGSAARVSRRH